MLVRIFEKADFEYIARHFSVTRSHSRFMFIHVGTSKLEASFACCAFLASEIYDVDGLYGQPSHTSATTCLLIYGFCQVFFKFQSKFS